MLRASVSSRCLVTSPLSFEGVDDAGHGWWPHLLGGGEVAETEWSAEDDDRQRGKPRGIEAAAFVFAAEFAEEMDGGGMELVGEFGGVGADSIDMPVAL